jgi:hypothetical protein
LHWLAGLDEFQREPLEQLSILDKAAALADQAARKQIDQKQGRLLAFKGQLLMSAAEIANRAADADAALERLKGAASAMDAAASMNKSDDPEINLNGAAIYAMIAALETSRGNTEAAEVARAEGRRRLGALDPSQANGPVRPGTTATRS